MDLDCLEASTDYTALKKCYVIFICTFDYFKKDAPVYFFRSWDVEKGLPLDDFSYKIVLNAACSPDKVPEKLRAFYAYINDPTKVGSKLIEGIDERVQKYNTPEWRERLVTLEYMIAEAKEEGLEQGRTAEKIEMAKALKDRGVDIEIIAETSGLSVEEIEGL